MEGKWASVRRPYDRRVPDWESICLLSSRGQKARVKVSAQLSLLALQMAAFVPCPHVVFPQYVHILRSRYVFKSLLLIRTSSC